MAQSPDYNAAVERCADLLVILMALIVIGLISVAIYLS